MLIKGCVKIVYHFDLLAYPNVHVDFREGRYYKCGIDGK